MLTDRVAWQEWSADTFARARDDATPVLLAIGAAWCHWCAEMARTTYADPVVTHLIRDRFVPVWVDADRRPDINERYNLGGWPTTAFLTPEGHVLGGETYVTPERMIRLLEQVANAFATRHDALSAGAGAAPERGQTVTSPTGPVLDDGFEDWVADRLRNEFDAAHGGFGTGAKRLQASALELALVRHHAGDGTLIPVVEATLAAIGFGGLSDPVDGGVFRYCAGRDWTRPSTEKVLEVNAAALRLFLDGWRVLGDPRYRERAVALVHYVRETLVDQADGGFFASQLAAPDYYAADEPARQALSAPPVDRSIYADSTARMATAFVKAAEAFEDESLLAFAVTSLERVVLDSYERGNGIAHHANGQNSVRGLLGDHVAVSDALLELHIATDREAYLDMAQELMLFAWRALRNPAGGFVDRRAAADDVGLLGESLVPFALNCEAARVLAHLARLTEEDRFRERAVTILTSQTAAARAHGVDGATYALALRELRSIT